MCNKFCNQMYYIQTKIYYMWFVTPMQTNFTSVFVCQFHDAFGMLKIQFFIMFSPKMISFVIILGGTCNKWCNKFITTAQMWFDTQKHTIYDYYSLLLGVWKLIFGFVMVVIELKILFWKKLFPKLFILRKDHV